MPLSNSFSLSLALLATFKDLYNYILTCNFLKVYKDYLCISTVSGWVVDQVGFCESSLWLDGDPYWYGSPTEFSSLARTLVVKTHLRQHPEKTATPVHRDFS
jgi:hypothetical protein